MKADFQRYLGLFSQLDCTWDKPHTKIIMFRTARRKRRSSLNILLMGLGLGTLLVLMAGFTLFSFITEQEAIKRGLDETAQTVVQRLSESLKKPLWNFDRQSILLTAEVEAKSPDVGYIIVYDESHIPIVSIVHKQNPDTNRIMRSDSVSNPVYRSETRSISYEGKNIGNVEVGITSFARQEIFTAQMIKSSLTQVIVSVITILAILLAVRMLILQRVLNLQQVVEQYGDRHFESRSRITRHDEIGELEAHFNRMADTIDAYRVDMEQQVRERTAQLIESEKLAFLGSLVAGMAHEINTPVGVSLTAITYLDSRCAELLRLYVAGELTKSTFDSFLEEVRHSTSIIISNLNRTSELVRTFKGIGADQLQDDYREFPLRNHLEEIVFSLTPTLKKNKPEIRIECDASIRVTSYPSAFYQIFTNLIMNSLIHGFAESTPGVIDISVKTDQQYVQIMYSDDGTGIPPEHLPSIFTPFFTTRRGQGGTGLGLYIIYTLVNKLDGTITCSSSPEKGTCFIIRIPRVSTQRQSSPRPGEKQ